MVVSKKASMRHLQSSRVVLDPSAPEYSPRDKHAIGQSQCPFMYCKGIRSRHHGSCKQPLLFFFETWLYRGTLSYPVEHDLKLLILLYTTPSLWGAGNRTQNLLHARQAPFQNGYVKIKGQSPFIVLQGSGYLSLLT